VPLEVLLGVSYAETQWEENGGNPRYAGGYGPMNLTDLTQAILTADGFGGDAQRTSDLLNAPALHTLAPAAALAGVTEQSAQSSDAANIAAGAALLASYEQRYNDGTLPTDPGAWYVAVARYSQAAEPQVAQVFADGVYAAIRAGAQRTTSDGQIVTLAADPAVRPDRGSVRRLHLPPFTLPPADPVQDPPQLSKPECPASLHCLYSPSGYFQYGPNKGDYGDHDLASRPANLAIRYITLHDNEETGDTTLWLFHDPTYLASANYEVFADGTVVQQVPVGDIAWDSANPAFYQHSIGIEQEGYAIDGATWYTPAMYRATAALVRYLAARYHIPLDHAHILGHDNIPGGNCDVCIAHQHWDPGPYWNWGYFFQLAGAPILPAAPPSSSVVTIDPRWQSNQQVVTGVQNIQDLTPYPGPYHGPEWPDLNGPPPDSYFTAMPRQPVSFVWLHSAPSFGSPLLSDPYLHGDPYVGTPAGPGTIQAQDWGDKAVTGQQFAVAGRAGDWTAIWYAGTKAWFYDPPGDAATAVPSRAPVVITPRPGLSSIPVYVDDYPLRQDYPAQFLSQAEFGPPVHAPTSNYQILAGQSYVAAGPPQPGDWYYAAHIDGSAPYDRTDFPGSQRFYLITYNHRMAFVNAADVSAAPSQG
jgi:N-acetyl-anhydromuramyl-L-alanine amidase AmpD